MRAARNLSRDIGVSKACEHLGVSRMTEYRDRRQSQVQPRQRAKHPRALTESEQTSVLAALSSAEYVDCAPAAVHAMLLEHDRYLCSVSTMYRLLRRHRAVRERRQIRRHATYEAPQLLATKPNQVWSWDITKLLGCEKFQYFHLYVMLDMYSRRVVGWMVAERESGTLASELIRDCCAREGISPSTLTIHSDRGAAMMSKPVVSLLMALDVHKTVSRPHVSNDNPFSEAQFKTMKYRPMFPKRFGSIQQARVILEEFFVWYNSKHRHSGIAYFTPDDVHFGRVNQLQKSRKNTLDKAYAATPERFVKGPSRPAEVPAAAWINPPQAADEKAALERACQSREDTVVTQRSNIA